MTHSTDKTTRFGSLVPFAEPAAIRVRWFTALISCISPPSRGHRLTSRLSPCRQDLPSPYYNESHHQLRKAARAWSVASPHLH